MVLKKIKRLFSRSKNGKTRDTAKRASSSKLDSSKGIIDNGLDQRIFLDGEPAIDHEVQVHLDKITLHLKANEAASMDNNEEIVNEEVVSDYEDDDENDCCANDVDGSDVDESFVGESFNGYDDDNDPSCNSTYATLSPLDLQEYQDKEIRETADLLSVSPSVSSALLRHFQWKREKLLTKYLENSREMFKAIGVPYSKESSSTASSSKGRSQSKLVVTCSVCADEVGMENYAALSCGHIFCVDCWENYITTKIKDGEDEIRCLQYKCNVFVDDVFVRKLVAPKVYERYANFLTQSFVEDNERVRWCPTPGCGNAITFDNSNSTSDSTIVKCSCGNAFCFKCHREAHLPATCAQMKQWEAKCQDDSETVNWMSVNCRECPKCDVAVEKNGGCNHMTCRQCKYEWCWVCMRSWKGHNDFYECNRFEKEKKREQGGRFKKSKRRNRELEAEKNRQALERYLHYYERYINHSHSWQLEKNLSASAKVKMGELHTHDATWAELLFIEHAVTELLECRNVLKYTYIFAYYFMDAAMPAVGAAKELFLFLQEDLEKTTERLSEVVDDLLKRSDVETSHKLDVINYTSLVRTKRENLLNAVARDPQFETP